jgi:S-adenosylmethionine hydrolase
VLAPVAAALCNGADLFDVGTPIDVDTLMPGVIPIHREENGTVISEVIWVDRFGNCQLNISRDDLEQVWGDAVDRVRVTLAGKAGGSAGGSVTGSTVRNVAIVDSFTELGQGALGLVIDSAGLLCLAVDRGSASSDLGIGESEQVVLSRAGDDSSDRQGSSGTTTSVAPPTSRR